MEVDNEKSQAINLLAQIRQLMENYPTNTRFVESLLIMQHTAEKYLSIDDQMIEKLNDVFPDSLIDRSKYDEMLSKVASGSVIVYFKSANKFKVYNKDNIDDELKIQLTTMYRHHLKEAYELIPNNAGQKIILVGSVSALVDTNIIKQLILDFMILRGISDLSLDDIYCFRKTLENGETSVQIVIGKYYVENLNERNTIVSDMMSHILKRNRDLVTLGLPLDVTISSDFENANMYPMPSENTLSTLLPDITDTLVRKIENCTKLTKNGNTYITIQVNNVNSNNTTNNTTNNIENVNLESEEQFQTDIDLFVEYIKSNKPEWYKDDNWISTQDLYAYFVEYTESDMAKNVFSKKILHVIVSDHKSKKISGYVRRFVKLIPIDKL